MRKATAKVMAGASATKRAGLYRSFKGAHASHRHLFYGRHLVNNTPSARNPGSGWPTGVQRMMR